jgi:hypothetical protein
MESYDERNITTVSEECPDGFRITVESENFLPDFTAIRDAMAARPDAIIIKKDFIPQKSRPLVSVLDFKIVDDRLVITRSIDAGMAMSVTFTDLISCSDRFFTDEIVNKKFQTFLSTNFPNDFERSKTYSKLLEEWNARTADSIPFEEFFNPDAKMVKNYAETFLMALGYAFPALFNHLPLDITSEEMFDVAGDMKSIYCDFMSASTEPELADMAFRVRRKAFRRLTPLLSVRELSLVYQLSETVSADILEWALRGVDFTAPRADVDSWYSDIEVLTDFSPTMQRNLVRDLFVHNSNTDDAFNMVKRYATDYSLFKGIKTIEQLHDKAMTIIPEITEDSRIANVDHSIRSAQEVFIPEISSKLELLVNQKEFVRIGKELNICIGSASYFEKSISGESYCYKILKDGSLIGAIEVSRDPDGKWRSVQCRGERNVHLDTESVIIEELLNKLEETPATLAFAGIF